MPCSISTFHPTIWPPLLQSNYLRKRNSFLVFFSCLTFFSLLRYNDFRVVFIFNPLLNNCAPSSPISLPIFPKKKKRLMLVQVFLWTKPLLSQMRSNDVNAVFTMNIPLIIFAPSVPNPLPVMFKLFHFFIFGLFPKLFCDLSEQGLLIQR